MFLEARPNFMKLSVHVYYVTSECAWTVSSSTAICTFGSADDVMFSHSGPYFAGDRNRV